MKQSLKNNKLEFQFGLEMWACFVVVLFQLGNCRAVWRTICGVLFWTGEGISYLCLTHASSLWDCFRRNDVTMGQGFGGDFFFFLEIASFCVSVSLINFSEMKISAKALVTDSLINVTFLENNWRREGVLEDVHWETPAAWAASAALKKSTLLLLDWLIRRCGFIASDCLTIHGEFISS